MGFNFKHSKIDNDLVPEKIKKFRKKKPIKRTKPNKNNDVGTESIEIKKTKITKKKKTVPTEKKKKVQKSTKTKRKLTPKKKS